MRAGGMLGLGFGSAQARCCRLTPHPPTHMHTHTLLLPPPLPPHPIRSPPCPAPQQHHHPSRVCEQDHWRRAEEADGGRLQGHLRLHGLDRHPAAQAAGARSPGRPRAAACRAALRCTGFLAQLLPHVLPPRCSPQSCSRPLGQPSLPCLRNFARTSVPPRQANLTLCPPPPSPLPYHRPTGVLGVLDEFKRPVRPCVRRAEAVHQGVCAGGQGGHGWFWHHPRRHAGCAYVLWGTAHSPAMCRSAPGSPALSTAARHSLHATRPAQEFDSHNWTVFAPHYIVWICPTPYRARLVCSCPGGLHGMRADAPPLLFACSACRARRLLCKRRSICPPPSPIQRRVHQPVHPQREVLQPRPGWQPHRGV